MTACMGGWCQLRDKCRHYTARSRVIVERLCETDETDSYEKHALPSLPKPAIGIVSPGLPGLQTEIHSPRPALLRFVVRRPTAWQVPRRNPGDVRGGLQHRRDSRGNQSRGETAPAREPESMKPEKSDVYQHFDAMLSAISDSRECGISKVQIIENLGITNYECARHIQFMKRRRLICSIGSARGSFWILSEYQNHERTPEQIKAVLKLAEEARFQQIARQEKLILDAIPDLPVRRRYSIAGDQPPPPTTGKRSVFELA